MDELKGKKVVVLCNLKPVKMRGVVYDTCTCTCRYNIVYVYYNESESCYCYKLKYKSLLSVMIV